jgi:hypothetical protein
VPTVLERAREKSTGGRQIPPEGYQHVDDLAILIDCPVQVPPLPGDVYIRLVSKPAISRDMPARAGRLDEQWGKPLYPPVHGHVIDGDATLGQQFFDVSIRRSIRKYHRTAIVITSEGKRNPAKLDLDAGS